MNTRINVHEAKTHLSRLLRRVMQGESFVIAKAGKPVAILSPFEPSTSEPRQPGGDTGKVWISPAFEDPLPEFDG